MLPFLFQLYPYYHSILTSTNFWLLFIFLWFGVIELKTALNANQYASEFTKLQKNKSLQDKSLIGDCSMNIRHRDNVAVNCDKVQPHHQTYGQLDTNKTQTIQWQKNQLQQRDRQKHVLQMPISYTNSSNFCVKLFEWCFFSSNTSSSSAALPVCHFPCYIYSATSSNVYFYFRIRCSFALLSLSLCFSLVVLCLCRFNSKCFHL